MSLRVLLSVTHLLGVGHLNRAATIARALAEAGHEVTLVSGGLPSPLLAAGDVRLVQLPPVKVAGTAFSRLLSPDGELASPSYLAGRREALLAALETARPKVVITELYPFGRRALAAENHALVAAARRMNPRPAVLASVRDVLVASSKRERIAETHDILRAFYDAVLVHGDPAVLPLEASWPIADDLRPLLRYTGYIDDGRAAEIAGAGGAGEILVSGGGSAASLPLYRSAVAAAREIAGRRWRILVGAGVSENDFLDLRADAPAHVTVERARPDFPALLGQAAVAVSQFGYNTAVDLLRAGTRAVVVPFEEAGETEQRLRAERFAREGLLTLVPQADLSPEALAAAIRAALAAPPPPAASIDRQGLARSVTLIEAIAAGSGAPQRAKGARSGAWQKLDDALKARADAGQPLRFWWRDDDAIAPTPALDRLLVMARGYHLPLALAVIPAAAQPALAERLKGEPAVDLLVHGLRHENHATLGEKKAEFGPHRPLAALVADASAALSILRAGFGEQLVPVFVPPWNRVSPALVPVLPELGYRGLSTFGRQGGAPNLVIANTHCDPIDWHGGRGLADEGELLARLTAHVADAPAEAPVGLLTHHLVQDEIVWGFCERLLEHFLAAPAVRPLSAAEIFLARPV
ncbi:glycosyltransferase [Chelatococcus sp. GCM10030263]|uniref:glycosyltransferase n=1 Tax=Chelatococcus sp. GCM10030263 TaxID=3273387 RepID=UPI00361BD543